MPSDVLASSDLADAANSSVTTPLNLLSVEVLETAEAIFQIKDQWLQLERLTLGNAVFQSFAWSFSALQTLDVQQSARIFVVYDQQRLVAILPLKVERQKALRVLTGLAEPFQQYSEMLIAPSHDPSVLMAFLRPYLTGVGADIIHLRQIREGGALDRYAKAQFTPVGEEDGAPWLDLTQWENFDDYLKSISARSRKTIRNQRNRLHKSDGLTHRIFRHGDAELERLILRTLKGRRYWVEAMGYTSRALEGDGMQNFLLSLCHAGGDGCELVALELKHGDVPISTEWGFLFDGCYSAFMADWNPDYEQSSPGKLHQMDVIEACFQLDVRKIDFLKPASRYKMTWTSQVAPVFDAVSPLSFKGRVYANLWLGNLRPLVKRLVLAMPKGMRSPLISAVKKIIS
ncbi:GNAT family N-acetyltransferase [Pseudovibrio sp. Tun.PSC04-5.I4]|uniref:GNAT family N-acetyltransferase n=1 Tax=Pseudovibrio sp. Tun.PSC04-5.I4 TaxID=1798213 RepID=UPI000880AC0B|nr:GNAT family N-acetyltransferase [Pseudovibrio sp. Tun.PSC04-5.I4]SDR23326.1 Acetyltransferase involved in cellulose biosynthesis, CelD/BcsL family [Pseudovibrio sp. Tun.PSC04-5.I4]